MFSDFFSYGKMHTKRTVFTTDCVALCAKHPHSGAAITAVLSATSCLSSPWRAGVHSPPAFPGPVIPKGGFPPFAAVVKCPGKSSSVEEGFVSVQRSFLVQPIATEVKPAGAR